MNAYLSDLTTMLSGEQLTYPGVRVSYLESTVCSWILVRTADLLRQMRLAFESVPVSRLCRGHLVALMLI